MSRNHGRRYLVSKIQDGSQLTGSSNIFETMTHSIKLPTATTTFWGSAFLVSSTGIYFQYRGTPMCPRHPSRGGATNFRMGGTNLEFASGASEKKFLYKMLVMYMLQPSNSHTTHTIPSIVCDVAVRRMHASLHASCTPSNL